MTAARERALAVLGLLAGAVVWGVVWYPYRLLEAGGIHGVTATLLTYLVTLAAGGVFFRRRWRALRRGGLSLLAIALAYGWTNLAYVLAVVGGEVVRVMLLFYLAPLWTVLLARALLGERAGGVGYAVVGLSLAGAALMLWRPDIGLPLPRSRAEWLGLSAGFGFALGNVLARRAAALDVRDKSLAIWLGSAVVPCAFLLVEPEGLGALARLSGGLWLLAVGIGLSVFLITLGVQYGLARVSASRAGVLFLLELVVVAASAWWLLGETLAPLEWLGAALIVAASLFAGKLEQS